MSNSFIAIDWGTTNRRIYVIADGQVVHTDRDDAGALRIDDFAGEMAAIRLRFGDLPAIMAGMVGSSVGWQTVPYVAAPAGLSALAAGLTYIDKRTVIVPGLSFIDANGHYDIMRGEEVQLLGAIESGMVPPDAVLCQPGTHCKWVSAQDGQIIRFVTAMTGELFALLRSSSILASLLQGGVDDIDSFREGVAQGKRRDLAASLFSIRANAILANDDSRDAASFASGLLIGADVAARLADIQGRIVHILADQDMGMRYATAISDLGGEARVVDSHAAFAAGIAAIWKWRT